jgi:hypothetical protein
MADATEAKQALAFLLEAHRADPDAVNVAVDLGRLRTIAAALDAQAAADVATESAVEETASSVKAADQADA